MNKQPIVKIIIQEDDFNSAVECAELKKYSRLSGAIVEFTGCVRADEKGKNTIDAIFLEHYSPMTELAIESIINKAAERWQLLAVTVIHRVGKLNIDDNIVYVGVSSMHRKEALACVGFVMDFLKNDVPIWKKELLTDGAHWVEQKNTDVDAKANWD